MRGSRTAAAALCAAALLFTGCAIPRWPLEGALTSPFGLRMRGLRPDLHHGVDIRAPEGTPVRAMKPGTVVSAGRRGGYGLAVVLDHGGGLLTLYAHLSHVEVRAGERVAARALLGRSGSTGDATGPHLHFEVLRRGRPVDPVPLLGGEPGR